MNKLNKYRLLAILVPIICFGLGAWLTWSQYQRLKVGQIEHDRVEKNLEFQKQMIATIGSQPVAEKEPTAPISDAEQAGFLDGLRTLARDTGVVLTKWSNVETAPGAPKEDTSGLPAGVGAIRCTLEVVGPFDNVRSFLYAVGKAPRLLNFSGIKWVRSQDGNSTVLNVTITRYISNAPAAPASQTPASNMSREQSS
ncbi:MAG TPA: hypothetical protein VJ835_08740 [Fimbriimonadaceae bacterium]|nr:hypothetical protein [Fimbriimonadaceae bacterium]